MRTGTVDVAQKCLPKLECVTVAGSHFDFIKTNADGIAEQVDLFASASILPSEYFA